jgi:hypothetical protein
MKDFDDDDDDDSHDMIRRMIFKILVVLVKLHEKM